MEKEKSNLQRKYFFFASYLAVAAIFLFFGTLLPKKEKEAAEDFSLVRQSGYKFISPLLECEIDNADASQKYVPFELETKSKIQKEIIEKNPGTHLSVYFRNLNNGPWFGINEKENFSPASLMKVPLLMAYFKLSEKNPAILDNKLGYSGEKVKDFSQNIVSGNGLAAQRQYSIGELLEKMIVDSDNEAASLLLKNIGEKDLNAIYADLGIIIPSVRDKEDFLSVKEYSTFFRILYNSSYLSQGNSERALEILSRSNYDQGLKRDLPKDISVSHKFGERDLQVPGGESRKQLHDCGIIYYRNYPYLLCVMTRGSDFAKLSEIIGQTSKIVWDELGTRFGAGPK